MPTAAGEGEELAMATRRIDPVQGREALAQWCRAGSTAERPVVATAVRYTLEELALQAPGRSVEVRVPPFGAVQVIGGPAHRRGTPPNVIEVSATTWLALAIGDLSWDDAERSGQLQASGERADLTSYLPLLPRSALLGVPVPEPGS